MALDLGPISIVIAMIFSIISTFGSYYYSDKIVLSINKARPATKDENLKLVNILDALVVSSGLPCTPKLYIIEDSQPNAFATGRNPENAVICVTTGLLNKLEYYELEGVLAHEMAHIKNYDIRLSAVVSVMVGFVVMLSDWFSRIVFWGGTKDRDNNKNGNGILMLIGLIFLILSPIFGKLMQLAISRKREFLADATAVQFTRNPDGLISALEKISADPNQLKVANNATENMYIINPFRSDKKKKYSSLWSTHPDTQDRIDALRNLK
jgi:heat shock protein HtpX